MEKSSTLIETNKLKIIEKYLKDYNNYKVGIKNLEKQLEQLLPGVNGLQDYDYLNGNYYLQTRDGKFIIDRYISKKAFMLIDDMERFKMIVNAIDTALNELDEVELKFIDSRYKKGRTIVQTSFDLGYSEKYIFNLRKKILDKLLIPLKGLIVIEY